jgi:ABC-type nitrate/sulfonate/bicarbonate transport system permease component
MKFLTGILAWLRGTLPVVLVLLLWQLAGNDASSQFPPPSKWFAEVTKLAQSGTLGPAIAATISILVVSLVLATLTGFLLGLLIGTSPKLQQWSALLLEYTRAVPPPVLIPVIVLLLGYSDVMKIVVIGFAGLWPVLLNTISGVSQIRPITFDVARSLRLSRFETLIKIVVPATVPSLLLGIRVALPHTIIITLVVEMFTGAIGIGGLMINAERSFNAPGVFGLLILVGCLGFALTALFSTTERLLLWRWPSRETT